MAAKNFYDAVMIGLNLPSLLAAALLSKRGFRVLVIGHAQPWPSYEVRGMRFPTAPFALPAPDSPVLARIFSELALRPTLQRRLRQLNPPFQAVLPGHRMDMLSEPSALNRELTREFPDARPAFEELLRQTALTAPALDALLARDLMWPPSGWLENRDFTNALKDAPLGSLEARPIWPELDPSKPLGSVLAACVDRELDATPRVLRNLRSVLCSAELDEGGLTGLYELLIETIRHHNGVLRLTERVDRLSIKRGVLSAVHSFPSDEEIGCHYMLWALPIARLMPLLDDRSELLPLFAEVGEPRPRYARFTLNLLVRAAAIPEGMARRALVIDHEPLWVEVQRLDAERALMTVQARIDLRAGMPALAGQRERMLDGLTTLSPFLREHLELIDSPHDGLAIQDVRTGQSFMPSEVGRRGPDTMEVVYTFPQTRLHGAVGLDVRTPIKRLLLCNTQVVPGFDFEGTLLSAYSAARAVTRSLGRDWMNRGRWTKVEL